ncbi:MAG: DUF2177 family protein, partial [Bacteroidota bacterium]|nr:DUF2177 family protein [Bacteroidota bacterium]
TDMIYLSSVKNLYGRLVKRIQGSDIKLNMTATILDYILIVFSIYYFIILKNASIQDAMILGLCIYGIYELTSMAILKNWTWDVVIIDSIWGAILYGTSTFLYRKIIQKLI